jgi:hypothetical protein
MGKNWIHFTLINNGSIQVDSLFIASRVIEPDGFYFVWPFLEPG